MTQSSPTDPKKIIVRMPNWLGDLVMATPVLHDLRNRFPHAHITAMCQGGVGGLLQENPHVDEIYSFSRPSGWIHRSGRKELIENLRHGEYDLGILLTNSFSSAWWFWKGHIPYRLGFATHWRSFLLTKAVPLPKKLQTQHLVLTYKALLEPLGIAISNTAPELFVSKAESLAAQDLLAKFGIIYGKNIIVGINPGAAYGSAKCWLPDRFEEVARKLLENEDVCLVFFGDKTGAPLVDDICQKLPQRTVNLAGKTSLRELVALTQLSSIFLTNDSGPMHIAAALKKPLVALFGSTSDVKTGPYGGGTVIHKHVECSPCYKRECPIDFRCMKRIGVDEVYAEIQKLMH